MKRIKYNNKTCLACGLSKGNKLLQTSKVPQKLVFTVTSACSEKGSVAATYNSLKNNYFKHGTVCDSFIFDILSECKNMWKKEKSIMFMAV